jgi:hypothetical protein
VDGHLELDQHDRHVRHLLRELDRALGRDHVRGEELRDVLGALAAQAHHEGEHADAHHPRRRGSRVPIGQSEEMYTALKWKGVPVEFVRYPREGHGVAERAHQEDFMNASSAGSTST